MDEGQLLVDLEDALQKAQDKAEDMPGMAWLDLRLLQLGVKAMYREGADLGPQLTAFTGEFSVPSSGPFVAANERLAVLAYLGRVQQAVGEGTPDYLHLDGLRDAFNDTQPTPEFKNYSAEGI